MEKESKNNNAQTTYCRSCGRYILTSNFLLHEGRCERASQLRSSRVSQNSQNEYPQLSQKKQKPIEQKNSNSKYSYPNMNKKQFIGSIKKTISSVNNSQNQEKIPCVYCGYMQTYSQLDTHPNQCQHREVQCNFCAVKYPKSLMDDHTQICQKNPINMQRNQHRHQMRRGAQFQQGPQYQNQPMFYQPRNRQMYSPSPLMNIFSDPFFNMMSNRQNPNRQEQGFGPSFNFVQFSTNSNGQPPGRVIIRSNSSNPTTFIQLIEMLARRANPNENPGLNEQELQKLDKIKYQKKNQEPDLCTICYCEFQQNQEIIELKCKHIFHQECIFEWLKRVSNCPVCKKKLKEGSNRQEQQPQNQHHSPQHHHHHHHGNGNGSQQQGGRGFFNFF